MRRFNRGEPPDFLIRRWRYWGNRYRNNRQKNHAFTFQWPLYDGQPINHLLKPLLAKLTNVHCSFCDSYPIPTKEESIDHFKPKSKPAYYGLVCQWENLYYCCQNCQRYKREQYNQFLLRPDDINYSFDTYFIYSFASHEIAANPVLTPSLKRKAETTIKVFGLNDVGRIAARRISLERYESKKILGDTIDINDFPFRFTIIE
jgi:uncharacterized protein (TIGR02646 family)